MPARCRALTMPLNSRTCSPRLPVAAYSGVRGEEADRAVAPVVRQPALGEERLVDDVVDRQQLDGGDAERPEVRERRVGGQAGVGAAQVLGHVRDGSFVKPLTWVS